MKAILGGLLVASIPTIPNLVLIVVVVLVLVGLFLGYTKSGRRVYAIGTSRESSHVAGIKDGNVELMVYTINGALCGMAGMLYTANYVLGYYGMADSFEMTAIAICKPTISHTNPGASGNVAVSLEVKIPVIAKIEATDKSIPPVIRTSIIPAVKIA